MCLALWPLNGRTLAFGNGMNTPCRDVCESSLLCCAACRMLCDAFSHWLNDEISRVLWIGYGVVDNQAHTSNPCARAVC